MLKDGNVVVKVMELPFHADLCRIADIESEPKAKMGMVEPLSRGRKLRFKSNQRIDIIILNPKP